MIYESMVIYFFIKNHPELSQGFLDHEHILRCRILEANKSQVLLEKHIDKRNSLIAKYGTSFNDTYGWASSAFIPGTKVNIEKMAEMMLFPDFSLFYRISSNFIHPNSYSILSTEIIDRNYVIKTMIQSIQILINVISSFIEDMNCCLDKDRVILQNILINLFNNYYNAEKIKNLDESINE
jgi:hypothetical protein